MGLFRYWVALCVGVSLQLMSPAHAYVATVTGSGVPIRWKGAVKLDLAGNSTNTSGIAPEQFFNAVVNGLQRWKTASGGSVLFDYWQGTNPKVYEANSEYNGLSSIYFASQGGPTAQLSAGVLGLTQVWYNTETGEILETDTVLNDRDFYFTTNPKDTSGLGSGGTGFTAGRSRVFIENVITHELGHSLGLSHTGHLQSAMLFLESPEQARLSCDELVAIHAQYPSGDQGARGEISGTVVSEGGAPIFGAHVLAISRRRGAVLATGLTDPAGRYTIRALEPGEYFLMAEPFFAGAQALPAFYAGMNNAVCSRGNPFGRTLLTGGSSRATSIHVSGGGAARAPNIVARCSDPAGAAVSSLSSSLSTALPNVFDGATDGAGFGFGDRLDSSGSGYYALKNVSGHLEVHVMSYSLYSPIHPDLALVDPSGRTISAQVYEQVYTGESGYVNYDSALIADGLAPGNYTLRINAAKLSASLYPAGGVSLDSVPFVVVTGSMNEGAPALADSLPFNARCRLTENFGSYSSPPGDPPRRSTNLDDRGVGFCGSLANLDRGGGGGGDSDPPGPSASAILGWFLPWFFMLAVARLSRLRVHPGAANL